MRTFVLTAVLAAAGLAQPAVNFSGKWIIQGAAGRGGGRGGPQVLIINHVGAEISGDLSGGGGGGGSTAPVNTEIWDGKASGDTLSFYVWRGSDKPVKIFYRGQLNAAGDEMAFTVTGGPQGRGGDGRGGQDVNPPAAAASAQPSVPVIAKRAK